MAPRTGVLLMFNRSASSASRIQVPGESLPCTISSLISRNAVSKLVPCSAFALGPAALKLIFFFIDGSAVAGNGIMLQCQCIVFSPVGLHEFSFDNVFKIVDNEVLLTMQLHQPVVVIESHTEGEPT